MAMKENSTLSANGVSNVRMTRSCTIAGRTSRAGVLSLKPHVAKPEKKPLQKNVKRMASEDNSHGPSVPMASQNKKRAVLKDVSNVFCNNSHKNLVNSSKIQTKRSRQAKVGNSTLRLSSNVKDSLHGDAVSTKVVLVDDEKNKENTKGRHALEMLKNQDAGVPSELEEHASNPQNIASIKTRVHVFRGNFCEDHINIARSKIIGPSSSEKDKFCDDPEGLPSQSYIDIDLDHNNPQMCCLYACEIYTNLRASELERRPRSDFMEKVQRDITESMRAILIDWLVEVSDEYRLVPDTLYLTTYLIDLFLSQNYIERQRLQLLGITCMLIASKYEEICAPRVEDFCLITDSTYNKEEVLKMETQVLTFLGFQLSVPTIKVFLRRFIRAAQACNKVPTVALSYLANYLAELTLIEYGFLKFLPSATAASAVFLANWTLDQSFHPWNPTLEHYTLYKAADLREAVYTLQDLQMNIKGSCLNAVRDKYKQEKFDSVASLTSPKLLERLFF